MLEFASFVICFNISWKRIYARVLAAYTVPMSLEFGFISRWRWAGMGGNNNVTAIVGTDL